MHICGNLSHDLPMLALLGVPWLLRWARVWLAR